MLSRTHGDLVVSKYRLRQAEGVALVRSKRDAGQQTLGFTSRPFVLCGLPLRRPPAGQLKHERRNGRFTLQVVGHPDFGLPFGQDRLVPIFLATLAVRQRSPIVRFSGGQEVLDMFGLARGGKEYRRMVSALNAFSVPRSSLRMSPESQKLVCAEQNMHRCRAVRNRLHDIQLIRELPPRGYPPQVLGFIDEHNRRAAVTECLFGGEAQVGIAHDRCHRRRRVGADPPVFA